MIDRLRYWVSRRVPIWLLEWWIWKRHGIRPFRPMAIEFEDPGCTEMLLVDGPTAWKPWGENAHSVDLGYDRAGKLVGIRIWDRVLTKNSE